MILFSGRNFEYQSALSIIQNEEYLDDIDFDDIRRARRASNIINDINDFNPNNLHYRKRYVLRG